MAFDKQDNDVNGSRTSQCVQAQKEREKNLRMLRITDKLVILVPPEKCNEAYAQWYRENKLNQVFVR